MPDPMDWQRIHRYQFTLLRNFLANRDHELSYSYRLAYRLQSLWYLVKQ